MRRLPQYLVVAAIGMTVIEASIVLFLEGFFSGAPILVAIIGGGRAVIAFIAGYGIDMLIPYETHRTRSLVVGMVTLLVVTAGIYLLILSGGSVTHY